MYLLFDNVIQNGIEDTKSELQKGAEHIRAGISRVNAAINLANSNSRFNHILRNHDYTQYLQKINGIPLRIDNGDLYPKFHKAAKRMYAVQYENALLDAIKEAMRN
jgi:hypothetical protein